jgi:hypothetical protein
MEEIDLNIDNYELQDILNLFNINYDFGEKEMRIAKKIVLQSHPDKSKLDKKYFLFFTKAYKYLYFIYDFRKKKFENEENSNQSYENIIDENNDYENIITEEERKKNFEVLANNNEIKKNFNSWFNKMFDEHKLESDYEKKGYGDWMKDDNNFKQFDNCNNVSKMNESINKLKNDNYSIIKREDFQENLSISRYNNGSDLLNDKLEDYSSGELFSKFGYNDLRKAHEESLIPVSESIKRQEFNSVGDYEIFRSQQEKNNTFYSLEQSKELLNNNKKNLEKIDNERVFRLAKQDEEVEKLNNQFWSKIKLLKN